MNCHGLVLALYAMHDVVWDVYNFFVLFKIIVESFYAITATGH